MIRHEARGAHWLRWQLRAGRSTSQSSGQASAKLSDEAPAEPQGMEDRGFSGDRKNSRNERTKKMNGRPTTR